VNVIVGHEDRFTETGTDGWPAGTIQRTNHTQLHKDRDRSAGEN